MLHKPTLHLPRAFAVSDVADAARSALNQFLGMEPDKRSLSEWLVNAYAHAVGFAPARPQSTRPSHAPSASASSKMSQPERIEDLVASVKAEARLTVAAALDGGPEALVQRLPSVVHILRVDDSFGAHGFAPIDAPRLRLNDRVLSLIVADFLTRPDDFARAMASAPRRITRSGISVRLDPFASGAAAQTPDKDVG
ncbi:hypothetical protein BH09MYX1_BH09MYX1_31120 [soil metagenome]